MKKDVLQVPSSYKTAFFKWWVAIPLKLAKIFPVYRSQTASIKQADLFLKSLRCLNTRKKLNQICRQADITTILQFSKQQLACRNKEAVACTVTCICLPSFLLPASELCQFPAFLMGILKPINCCEVHY